MRQHEFPKQAFSASMDEPVKLEGQKVEFDKKVSLLPVDVKMLKEKDENKGKRMDGRSA